MAYEVSKREIREALEGAGLDPDTAFRADYQGRGFHSRSCPGIVGSLQDFAMFLVEFSGLVGGYDAAQEMATRVDTDDMGKDTIFYFPGLVLAD